MSDIFDKDEELKEINSDAEIVAQEESTEDSGKQNVSDKKDAANTSKAGKSDNSEYEDVCFVCRRPESKAGKMF